MCFYVCVCVQRMRLGSVQWGRGRDMGRGQWLLSIAAVSDNDANAKRRKRKKHNNNHSAGLSYVPPSLPPSLALVCHLAHALQMIYCRCLGLATRDPKTRAATAAAAAKTTHCKSMSASGKLQRSLQAKGEGRERGVEGLKKERENQQKQLHNFKLDAQTGNRRGCGQGRTDPGRRKCARQTQAADKKRRRQRRRQMTNMQQQPAQQQQQQQQQLLLAARKLLLPWLLPLFAAAAAASVAQDSMKIVERVNCKCSTSFIAQGKGLMCPLNLTEVEAEL